MDDLDLLDLSPDTVVVVPTSSLARDLVERHAQAQIDQNRNVWPSPRILVWRDFIAVLWQKNAKLFDQQSWINPAQAQSIWTSVIEASKRKDQGLLLLNTQQTVRAVTKSWALAHDWLISMDALANNHGEDGAQLLTWFDGFRQRLEQNAWVDRCLASQLLSGAILECDFNHLVFYAYDLMTQGQKALSDNLSKQGIKISFPRPRKPNLSEQRRVFDHPSSELEHALLECRKLIEENPKVRISLVIPDLQNRFHEVHRAAQEVFYPGASPLELQSKPLAYRFSLGEAMYDLPAIRVALALIDLLLGGVTREDFAFILRSRFIALLNKDGSIASMLAKEIQETRKSRIHIGDVCTLIADSEDLDAATMQVFTNLEEFASQVSARLDQQFQQSGFRILSIAEWLTTIGDWLDKWSWSTSVEREQRSTYETNLEKSWVALLETVASLNLVQQHLGAGRLRTILQQQCRETIFLPKSPASPLVISGVLEAIGRPADTLYLLSADQHFPKPPRRDAFISNSLLAKSEHPQALPESDFEHQAKVLSHLFEGASHKILSYSQYGADDLGVHLLPSRIVGPGAWQTIELQKIATEDAVKFDSLIDDTVPRIENGTQLKGGARIFENQAQCPFKAFASHRLNLLAEEENEFGLDPLDKGNAVHILLESLWGKLQSQSALLEKTENELLLLVENEIDHLLQDNSLELNAELHTLLQHEKPRLRALLLEWFELEKSRPQNFRVVERESKGKAQIAGIAYRYVVDRVDRLDDGRYVLIDYKTGEQSRKGLLTDRLESPQLPLYREAFEQRNSTAASGVAFAQVKRRAQNYVELAEDGIFRKPTWRSAKYAEEWQQASQAWRQQCEDLAQEFLAGRAEVNPLDPKKCDYCDFSSLCRISETSLKAGADNDQ